MTMAFTSHIIIRNLIFIRYSCLGEKKTKSMEYRVVSTFKVREKILCLKLSMSSISSMRGG